MRAREACQRTRGFGTRTSRLARAPTRPPGAVFLRVDILVDIVTTALCRRRHAYAGAPSRLAHPQTAAQAKIGNSGNCLHLKSLGALDLEWRHQIDGKFHRNVKKQSGWTGEQAEDMVRFSQGAGRTVVGQGQVQPERGRTVVGQGWPNSGWPLAARHASPPAGSGSARARAAALEHHCLPCKASLTG